MKALMKLEKGFNNMKVVDIDEPEVKDDLVKIKVKYCGICGSDLHAYQGTYPSTIPPVVLGHEFSGEVIDIGSKVQTINIGDRVTSETTFATCDNCEQCKTKNYNLCSNRKGLGTQVNGAMSTYVLSREESVHVLDDNVSYLSAALSEPLSCGVHASLEKVEVQKGDTVCVFGPGTIGILLAMVAKSKGARVIVAGVTRDEKRLELVKRLGLISVDQQKEDLKAIIDEHTQEKGVDFSFECSGVVKALNTALVITKKRGTIVQMGVFAKDFNEIDTQSILQKEINYTGSRSQKPSSWKKTMKILSEQVISPEQIVTSIISLENWKDGFENSIAANDIKVVIDLEKD